MKKPKNKAAQNLRALRDKNPKYGKEWVKKTLEKARKARKVRVPSVPDLSPEKLV